MEDPVTVASALPSLVRATDRCDRCGAEARVRVVITKSNLPLLFCAHHYAATAQQLAPIADITHDDRVKAAPAGDRGDRPAGNSRDPRSD
jgi:hypothetical protein